MLTPPSAYFILSAPSIRTTFEVRVATNAGAAETLTSVGLVERRRTSGGRVHRRDLTIVSVALGRGVVRYVAGIDAPRGDQCRELDHGRWGESNRGILLDQDVL
jgi:hypothetical protein